MKELDDLYALFGDQAPTLKATLEGNPDAKRILESMATVHTAFSTGDNDALAKFTTPQPGTRQPGQSDPRSAAFDLDQLNATLDSKLNTFKASLESTFDAKVKAEAKTIADAQIQEAGARFIGIALNQADEISSIRESHKDEFGKPLDRAKFNEFVANAGKENRQYSSLTDAYNAYVNEDRINARIEAGVKEKLAAQQTGDVPGASLPKSGTVLGNMIAANKLTPGEAGRGAAIDSAAAAFQQLRSGQAN